MRFLLISALSLICSTASEAQSITTTSIEHKSGWYFKHKNNWTTKYTLHKVTVPAQTFGFIGFRRVEGSGDMDVRIGTSLSVGNFEHVNLGSIVASNDSDDSTPDLLVIPPSNSTKTYYIESSSYDNKDGEWIIRYEYVDLWEIAGESFAWAVGQYMLEYAVTCALFGCSDDTGNSNLGRAVNLAMSLATRTNMCSVSSDVFINELQGVLSQELPNARFFVIWASNFGAALAGKAGNVMCTS